MTKCFRLTLLALFFILSLFTTNLFALEHLGRMGIGYSGQLANDIPAISLKVQQTKAFAIGGLLGINTSDTEGGYGIGGKVYRILFDEPKLNFYAAGMFALLNQKNGVEDKSGFQMDFTVGSEFHFAGLESLGLSFETGVSINKLDDLNVSTVGLNFINAEIHFYL